MALVSDPHAPFGWGRMLNKFHNEVPSVHLLRQNLSPACNTTYFSSAGALPDMLLPPMEERCKSCQGLYAKRKKAAEKKSAG